MANYFRCDTTFIKEAEKGRLYSTKPSTDIELPNGVFGFLGDKISGKEEIRTLVEPTADLIKNEVPVVIHNPEINYRQELSTDNALGIYRNEVGKVLRTYPLSKYDEIALSEDYFDLTGKTNGKIEEGDIFALQTNLIAGSQLKYSATAPTNAKVYFKVNKVENSHKAVFVSGNGQLFPEAYKLVYVEVIFA